MKNNEQTSEFDQLSFNELEEESRLQYSDPYQEIKIE